MAGHGAQGKYLGRTTPVGQYQPNKLGLYDMHGNVWQWCEDVYDNTGSDRVFRGGGWFFYGQDCRAGYRFRDVLAYRANGLAANGFRDAPSYRAAGLGFRLARVPSGS